MGEVLAAAAGPASSAALARTSASSAVGASAVAWTIPVRAGRPVPGSIRCQPRRVTPLVAAAPSVRVSSASTSSSHGLAMRSARAAPPARTSPRHSIA